MNKFYQIILIICFGILSSCNKSPQDLSLKQINAPDIISIFNNNYSKTFLMQDQDGYTFLSLAKNEQVEQQVKKLLQKYIEENHKKCFKFKNNRHGLHATLIEYGNDKYSIDFRDLIGREFDIQYTNLMIDKIYMEHSHNRKIVYLVRFKLKPEDTKLISSRFKYLDNNKLHVTLSLFEIDQDNECVHYHH